MKKNDLKEAVERDKVESKKSISRQNFLKVMGSVIMTGGVAGASIPFITGKGKKATPPKTKSTILPTGKIVKRVAADPTNIPAPIHRSHAITHDITLEAKEVTAEIEPGVTFKYMTWNGQIPGPMIRIRQGDTVNVTLKNSTNRAHNVDMHAVYGTGGGNMATLVVPGGESHMRFKAMYPGAFIYHCAVPNMDYHISSGMFGMIVVEPPEGLPKVDHEFYLGQNEIYTNKKAGQKGHHEFDFNNMLKEDPSYVVLNGEKHALTPSVHGAMKTKTGETARIFLVNGGPNLTSSFHPIGNIFTKAWRAGAIINNPDRYVQTMHVPPGSTGVFELEFPVPETIKLVDHALTRVVRKGMLGEIAVSGKKRPDIFDPNPTKNA
ncbi:MAG TPA: copper-containing nitrite reductase [Balneolales bacterium]|nr:copper-containing nitrite reductase [Balneolales bacterium]